MFFDMDLLCRQRQGKFALIWIAATRGITNVKKSDLELIDIIHICNEIIKYVMSNSTSLKSRLSLSLSAKLVYGTVLVYKQQIINFEKSILVFLCTIKRPLISDEDLNDEAIEKKRLKKLKVTKPRKSRAKNITDEEQAVTLLQICEQHLLQELPDLNANRVDAFEITLRDEIGSRIQGRNTDLFGDEGQIDHQLAQAGGDAWMNNIPAEIFPNPDFTEIQTSAIVPLPDLTRIQEEFIAPAVPSSPRKSRRLTKDLEIEESPSKRRRSEAQRAPEAIRSIEGDNVRMEVEAEVHAPQEGLNNHVVEPQPEQPVVTPKKRVRRRLVSGRKKNYNIRVESPTKWHMSRLDNSLDIGNVTPVTQRAAQGNDAKELIALILAGLRFDDGDVSAVMRGTKENISVESAIGELTVGPEAIGRRTIEPIPEQTFTNDVTLQEAPVSRPVDLNNEIMPDIPPMISPRLSRISAEINNRQITSATPKSRVHASTPKSSSEIFETEQTRQNNLLNRIRWLFKENDGAALTLEDLCFPLNRSNVARTFNDLLSLNVKQYIRLEHAPDSLELENIYPGNKINLGNL